MTRPTPRSTLFPYTMLFRSIIKDHMDQLYTRNGGEALNAGTSEDWTIYFVRLPANRLELWSWLESDRLLNRSEEHTSELQSLAYLVCRLLAEKRHERP